MDRRGELESKQWTALHLLPYIKSESWQGHRSTYSFALRQARAKFLKKCSCLRRSWCAITSNQFCDSKPLRFGARIRVRCERSTLGKPQFLGKTHDVRVGWHVANMLTRLLGAKWTHVWGHYSVKPGGRAAAGCTSLLLGLIWQQGWGLACIVWIVLSSPLSLLAPSHARTATGLGLWC